jgi:trk system potassium uptake protein TrkA
MISLEGGALRVIQRKIFEASPVVGVTLEQLSPPRGLLVGAVARGEDVFIPTGRDRILAGDHVILFVHQSELPTLQLFFPGPDEV